MQSTKRPRGGQPKPDEERLVQRSIRLLPVHWEKIDAYGLPWLRKLIERAKPPTT
jgi:hypothetical protein